MTDNTRTQTVPLRKGGRGLAGTIENAKHHAQSMLPFINSMKWMVRDLGFALWEQGHNLHQFTTTDGRKFTLRGIVREKPGRSEDDPLYIGVRLSLRLSRSEEIRLLDIDSVNQIPDMVNMMRQLATPQIGRDSRLMSGCGSN
jgi:hypothetical protein